jgi:hypothetical protein
MALSHDSDSGLHLPDELVDDAIKQASSSDPFLHELDDLAIRLRRAAQHSESRKVYGLADALNRAAASAESWGRSLREHAEDDR